MSELFDELQADLQQEKLQEVWKKIGKLLVGISAAVILVTIGYQILEHRRISVAMERTDKYLGAIESAKRGDIKTALAVLDELSSDESSPYYGIAMLKKAALQNAEDNKEGAAATYAKLAEKNDAYGQIAKLYADPKKQVATGDKTTPFHHLLKEREGWQKIEDGKQSEGIAIFTALYQDRNVPPSLRARMQEVLHHLSPDKLLEAGKTDE